MSVGDKTPEEVEVLYDYSYNSEDGLVNIREGDVFRLLERTNSEWWHVCTLDDNASSDEDDNFFVPAQYVRVLKKKVSVDQEVDSAISSLDDVIGREEGDGEQTNSPRPQTGQPELQASGQSGVAGGQPATQGLLAAKSMNGTGKNQEADPGDYVNLDEYRVAAKISPVMTRPQNTTFGAAAKECEYANLPFQLQQKQQQKPLQHVPHGFEQSPRLQDGHFVRVLVEGLPWDIYEDQSKRKFFHNRETGELTWKPPRKDKPCSPVNVIAPVPSFNQPPVPTVTTDDDQEYTKTEEGGDVFFVNNSTNEKWQQLKDTSGRQYYHRLGSNDTQWDLPTTPPGKAQVVRVGDGSPRNGVGAIVGGDSAVNASTLTRGSKSKSMYGKVEQQTVTQDPKACTLPPNFAPGTQIAKSPSFPTLQLQPLAPYRSEESYSSYLNKSKIADAGKKKIKKNWSQAWVVLQSSNLLFYKDQKAADKKPGSPNGKLDFVISLLGAKIESNLSKDITSRRNTIQLMANCGSQFLLHSDDDRTIQEWLIRLKIAANDIANDPSPRDHDDGTGRGVGRSLSESHGGEVTGGERWNILGIRAKLINFLIRRPTQEDLIKQGIIKDAVFGSSLQDLCERDKSPVPNFVLECITAVETKGLDNDGLYRISGNLAEIQKLRYEIDKDDSHNLLTEQWDIHTLTGALKLFFRELKEPLFASKNGCVDKFLNASKKESRKDKLKAFKEAVASLPKCNHETLRVLLLHLRKVVQHSAQNRMQAHNLAIVFGPTLMWAGENDFSSMAVLTVYQSKVVEFMLLEFENLYH